MKEIKIYQIIISSAAEDTNWACMFLGCPSRGEVIARIITTMRYRLEACRKNVSEKCLDEHLHMVETRYLRYRRLVLDYGVPTKDQFTPGSGKVQTVHCNCYGVDVGSISAVIDTAYETTGTI